MIYFFKNKIINLNVLFNYVNLYIKEIFLFLYSVNKHQINICNTTDICCQVFLSVKNFKMEALNIAQNTTSLTHSKIHGEYLKK